MTNDNDYLTYPITDNIEMQIVPKNGNKLQLRIVRNCEILYLYEETEFDFLKRNYLIYNRILWALSTAYETVSEVRWDLDECRIKFWDVFHQVGLDELNKNPPGMWLTDENWIRDPLQARTRHVIRTEGDILLVYLLPPSSSVLNGPQVLKFTEEELEKLDGNMIKRKSPLMFETPSGTRTGLPDYSSDSGYWDYLADKWRRAAKDVNDEDLNMPHFELDESGDFPGHDS